MKAVGEAHQKERHQREREMRDRKMGSENEQTSVNTCMKLSKNKSIFS